MPPQTGEDPPVTISDPRKKLDNLVSQRNALKTQIADGEADIANKKNLLAQVEGILLFFQGEEEQARRTASASGQTDQPAPPPKPKPPSMKRPGMKPLSSASKPVGTEES